MAVHSRLGELITSNAFDAGWNIGSIHSIAMDDEDDPDETMQSAWEKYARNELFDVRALAEATWKQGYLSGRNRSRSGRAASEPPQFRSVTPAPINAVPTTSPAPYVKPSWVKAPVDMPQEAPATLPKPTLVHKRKLKGEPKPSVAHKHKLKDETKPSIAHQHKLEDETKPSIAHQHKLKDETKPYSKKNFIVPKGDHVIVDITRARNARRECANGMVPVVKYTDLARAQLLYDAGNTGALVLCPVSGCQRIFKMIQTTERHIREAACHNSQHREYSEGQDFMTNQLTSSTAKKPTPCQFCGWQTQSGRRDPVPRHERTCHMNPRNQ
ncbi:hypothetical protein PENSPDRAFT_693060 [Peniophora sp. CONT]|nr:hypothetical protein PENSPDRAFT_693060 [Peniophora sp. CONT]